MENPSFSNHSLNNQSSIIFSTAIRIETPLNRKSYLPPPPSPSFIEQSIINNLLYSYKGSKLHSIENLLFAISIF
ncbi:hypothetical protein LguiB_003973 [Lonicera macranthoides]